MYKRMISFFSVFFLCVLTGSSIGVLADQGPDRQNIIEPGGFLHSVYFWLKSPNSNEDRRSFESHLTSFIDSSKYVKSKFIGTSSSSSREVVDSSYTYVLVLSFSSKEEQEKYQVEPAHLKFVEDARHLWEKVIVYDAFNSLN